jgi:O-antigen biosynthesis protein
MIPDSVLPAATPDPADSAPRPAEPKFPWQTCLNATRGEGHVYHHFNPALLSLFAHSPRTLLDIGCASGLLAQSVKAANPSCRTIGIEPDPAAARLAAEKLDQVLCGKFEDFNLEAEGIALGSIDTVVAADVLEHMYDPWRVMSGVRPFLSKDAQVIISLPNTRHLGLVKALLDDGRWEYQELGLLDITHIRFFTLREIEAFLRQTGYSIDQVTYFIDERFKDFYAKSKDQARINIRIGRVAMEDLTQKELAELCTWQFFIRARAT